MTSPDLTRSQIQENTEKTPLRVILSFDIEEHHRIEAAAHLRIDSSLQDEYSRRAADLTRWLIETLAERQIPATFFILGEFAQSQPALIREIHAAGHEVASHGWNHRSVLRMTPPEFREDIRRSKDTLEQITGDRVIGYRAPTFSIVTRTLWAIDELVDQGYRYDSSIYPVRHDRYGIPDAPRTLFLAKGSQHSILEIPPATLRLGRLNLPTGGGGYFRLFPLSILTHSIDQAHRQCNPPVVMLYFHPWEFDLSQPKLPLRRLSQLRTYLGIRYSARRLTQLLSSYSYETARDIATTVACG